jgi:hypothetical protein
MRTTRFEPAVFEPAVTKDGHGGGLAGEGGDGEQEGSRGPRGALLRQRTSLATW